ncbi:MAG: AsmA family protein [Nitrospira sp.]|jgi:AsmA protein|nr:MAG: AsmA family protein [Nitrospira sp.]
MKIMIGIGVLIAVLVGVALLLPFIVDLNKYQEQYRPLIEEALNRKVTLQDIRLTIWPRLGARVAGFTVIEDPAFGTGPFASLTSVDVGIKLMPLLSGKVEVEEITLREPVITVIKNKNGVLNASTLGRKGVAAPETPSRAPVPSPDGPLKILALLAVDRVSLVGGKVTYRDFSQAKPVEYILQDMELLLQSVHLGSSPNLHLGLTVQPMNLPVSLDGTFGPLKETAELDAINLQLALGKTNFAIAGKTAGQHMALTVTAPAVNTANLPMTLPLKKPVEVKDFKVAAEVKGQDMRLSDLSFQLFEGKVIAQGGLTSGAATPPFNGKLTLNGLQLGPAIDAVAETPVSISGTAGADLSVKGQGFAMPDLTRALEGAGHVEVKDGKIDGVNLLQEAVSILKVAGVSVGDAKATAFSTIETDLAIKQGVVLLQNMLMDSHDFQATGGGTIGFDHALNMTVNLRLSEALSQQVAGASPVARLAVKEGRLTLPLLIGGTLEAPSYGLDMKGLTGKVQEQIKRKAEEAIGGLLKGTTKPKDLEGEGKQLLKGLFSR